jgi:RNA polymerase sigma-70 factor (ECF subfamily)
LSHAETLPFADAPRMTSANAEKERTGARWSSLMAAAQDGDQHAYQSLLREILPLLRGICRSRLRDPSEAEDAVQDTLLTLHRVRATYDPARPFRPWLVAIAEHRALDRDRQRGRRAAREAPIEEAAAIAAPAGEDAESAAAAAHLRRAIADLPPAQRTALSLTKIEDLPLADAAIRSGMSVGALKVATHRAVRTLRRRLGLAE